MQLTEATIAEYFRLALELGLLEPAAAIAWADSLVRDQAAPSGEVIDVSLSHQLPQLLESLSSVQGDRNREVAGRSLLGLLHQRLLQNEAGIDLVARLARNIASMAGLGDDTYHVFDVIDDQISMASTGVYGTIQECRRELEATLEQHALPCIPAET